MRSRSAEDQTSEVSMMIAEARKNSWSKLLTLACGETVGAAFHQAGRKVLGVS
jgi:hypothetical protein